MRWMALLAVLLVAAVLQSTAVAWIRIHRIGPDLLFIVAVYYALHAGPADGLLAAWAAGLTTDLFSDVRMGTFAFAFGLVGLLVVRFRELVFRDHPVTQVLITAVGCGMAQVLAQTVTIALQPALQPDLWKVFLTALYTAVYTAVLAPYLLWLLGRVRGLLGLRPPGRLRLRQR